MGIRSGEERRGIKVSKTERMHVNEKEDGLRMVWTRGVETVVKSMVRGNRE